MYLAIREMRYAKLRYSLIIGIMFLISYVVFMLSGLATGLSEEFKKAIDDWGGQGVVLSEDANKTFAASQLTRGDLDAITAEAKAPIGLYSGAITEGDKKVNISFFGTTETAFLLPKVTAGRSFESAGEIIISQNLADLGYHVNDQVTIGSSTEKLTIVGIFPATYYAVTPVIYSSLDTWTALKFGDQPFASQADQPINLIATKGTSKIAASSETAMEQLTTADFIENLPGYSAQNLTLSAMIYFLFLIAAAIVGIFMYVITLQKTALFGVMKAQGINNVFIAKSLVAQSFLVGLSGVVLALLCAYLTSFVLPAAMPFAVAFSQWLLYSGILLAVAVAGGLFSIRTVAKVDPITAIGG